MLTVQQFIEPFSAHTQTVIFLVGIVLLGIPHGAADLLIAMQNTAGQQRLFSKLRFFVNYLGRLLLFAAVLWCFPLFGNVLFILFAAYHFGETDLFRFKTDSFTGKLFITSYGLVILEIILLHHFTEVKPLLQLFAAGTKYAFVTIWIEEFRYTILSFTVLLFFVSTFLYFKDKNIHEDDRGYFLVQFAFLAVILFSLPMMLGFTFYFIVWHSLLSMSKIFGYLRKDDAFPAIVIVKKIGIYSLIATAGIILFGLSGFMFMSMDSLVIYIFLGLAVLTAPHMQIMHDMYKILRSEQYVAKKYSRNATN